MFGCYESNGGFKILQVIFNKNQVRKAIQNNPIYLSDSDHDYILEKSNKDTQLNT